jgi:hypothetical protein
MEILLGFLVLLALALPLAVGIRRATELFHLRVSDSRVKLVRGRLPQALLSEIQDIVSRPPVTRARIRVVLDAGQARVIASGELEEGQVQQLRNVVGRFQVSQIRQGSVRR